ncbi:MAG: MMPL family transporter [Gammaproteobacteria bacterium]
MSRFLAWAWAMVVCVLLAHNAYLWLGKRIVPETDILALLPVQQRDPVLQQSFTHMVDAAQQRVIVLVGAPDWNAATSAADAYAAVLATRPSLLTSANLSAATQADWLAPFQKHAVALMSVQDQARLRTEPSQVWVEGALARLYGAFAGPKLGSFRDDPFGLFAGWVQERAGETPVRPRDGKLFVGDAERQYVVMPLTMTASALSMTAQQGVAPLLARAREAAQRAAPGVRVISAGVVLHAAAASAQAEREMSTIGVGSLIGIVLLTWLSFRSLRPIILVLLSIGVGFLGSLSICWLLFGRIHLLTLVFGASLIGVAQDYGIYFLSNRLSADPHMTSSALLRRLLPGLFLTLLAAVIGYMGLGFTPFPGLRHMAAFSGLGLVFAWLTVVCWFPLLLPAGAVRAGALARRYSATLARWPRSRFEPFSYAALAVGLLVAAVGSARLTTNDDIRSLQTPPKQLVQDQLAMSKLLDAPTPVQYFLVRGPDADTVLQREEALKRRLDPLVAKGTLTGYQALSNWVPSARTQQERRALLDAKLLGERGALAELAKAIGESGEWTAQTRAHLLQPIAPLTAEAFLALPASEPWRHLWLGKVDGVVASIVALRGASYAALPTVRAAGQGVDGVQWVDKVAEISSVLGQYRAYMGQVVALAYVLVFALLWTRYRKRAWRVLAPTAVASLVTLGVLGLTGQSLQLFHVLALMLLLGVGVDYGIFMHEQSDQPGHGRDGSAWLAVGLSAANTILSFGLLALSNTPALRAFGATMLVGTALAWLLAPCFTQQEDVEHA